MFKNTITFSAHEDYVNNCEKDDFPIPIKLNIPDWYKKMKHGFGNKTLKGCIPFLDTLTSGYLLKNPQDLRINHNVFNNELGKQDSFSHVGRIDPGYLSSRLINLTVDPSKEVHPVNQVEGSPLLEKNKNLPVYKILNPWIIKTPPGYSTLFLPPMNNGDDRFSIIPGIVDTDTFQFEVNFPFIINGDKYQSLQTVIKKGTPYCQVIPFKRDSWKMKIKKLKIKDMAGSKNLYWTRMLNIYKNKFWSKKTWT